MTHTLKIRRSVAASLLAATLVCFATKNEAAETPEGGVSFTLNSQHLSQGGDLSASMKLTGFYYKSVAGRMYLPTPRSYKTDGDETSVQLTMPDGHVARVVVKKDGDNFSVRMTASPESDISGWGLSVEAVPGEYFTGLMERVVDGPQQASWEEGITEAMNLRGQQVDMILKPTTSVYAPFYISSRGYGVFARTDWPGHYDFCNSELREVQISFEGPSLDLRFYTADQPVEIVKAHALDAGPPFLPPKWLYSPWRWRDEHVNRTNYYDGTPVTGPFNSEVMEDILMMKAYGIPCGVYWIDRPWGPGMNGCDDFEIDDKRLPHFAENIEWLEGMNTKMVMWIAPFFQGHMETNALASGYCLPGQKRTRNNYPMVDLTNPDAKKFWQDGVAKFLKLGVAGFKLDRAEEQIPEDGPYTVYDGRSIRENRNAYPPMYVRAVAEIAQKYRGTDFAAMPRAAYTGSSHYGVFWGGDIGGNQEGLRATIIAAQRAAVMGYPNWGSDTCGYSRQLMEHDVCARWLELSCFHPIMEVGPTRNVAFWNMPHSPSYDSELIAIWRLYARLHQRLADYGYQHAMEATMTGMPIVRPLFLVDPKAPEAWANWWTYQYGSDILVSAIWKKGQRSVQVYLPSGSDWRDAWNPDTVYAGGQTMTIQSPLHQMPIFIREGSSLQLGDLKKEWEESQKIAKQKPDLAALDAELKDWWTKK